MAFVSADDRPELQVLGAKDLREIFVDECLTIAIVFDEPTPDVPRELTRHSAAGGRTIYYLNHEVAICFDVLREGGQHPLSVFLSLTSVWLAPRAP